MHDHDRGLEFDLATLRSRRSVLALFGGAGLAVIAGCAATDPTPSPATTSTGTAAGTTAAGLEEIPEETAGPFPGDGFNGPDVLTESGIVRGDIRSSFGSASGTADGVPLRIELTVVEADTGAALPGAAVYVWHCDRNGDYSLYSDAAADQNYLRGVQEADDTGDLVYTSIFPAAYAGRWPHVHFEVYPTLADATNAGTKLTTSQLALPQDVCETVYATDGYDRSVRNLAGTSLERDTVFSDGWDSQLATVTGDPSGYTATLTVAV
ncbi:MAG: 3,4-dioxygenase subunit beta [Actinophytocola sp.]|uniref:dioxygenase family protein n=1 Tax=Actinophytocola sp. TaxID=1872138 RepID=UPI001328F099|nr:intradiol ring-cleavage dioxygenase [Actinophytocola sp.]MPZ85503.1 3,4-dioxygenase subunit beta [Actinophytocola sp.]